MFIMIYLRILFFIFIFNSLSNASTINIDEKTVFYELLSSSEIYIDKTKKLDIEDVKKKKFEKNNKKLLGYGYSPNFDVWVRFTLKNNTQKLLHKIVEYDNSLTTDIRFYDPDIKGYIQEGLFHIKDNRKSINPVFKIELKPHETKTYYLKVSSYITTMIIELKLWDIQAFYEKEIKHQFILALFFGAMMILGFYNLFIYFFTRDISYLFYVLYIVGIVLHHLIYVGISNIYMLSQEWIIHTIEFGAFIVAFPALALGLFTKTFLRTKQYPVLDKILNIFLILIPVVTVVFLFTDQFNSLRNLMSFSLLVYLMLVTIYAAIKKNRQAYFILFGWVIFLTAGMFMYLSSAGIFSIYEYFSYIIELSLVLEVTIFSIALSDRIKHLQKEKDDANKKLIAHQRSEQQRLQIKVDEKTSDLKKALSEKGLLLKELNHRVKNNMQTIVSLIRLQVDEIEDEKIRDIFTTVQNRINAMGHLHEMLYKQDNISYIDAKQYFRVLIDEIRESYTSDITIYYNIKVQLKMEQAIYCGLILNELITNSFKYAFPEKRGIIHINLEKKDDNFIFEIFDDGIGYDKSSPVNSLGLVLVDTLAKDQLRGEITTDTTEGVKVMISW